MGGSLALYWIETKACRLGIMPRPRGGDWLADEIKMFKASGVDVIVSALGVDEATELDLLQEEDCCRQGGVEFISFPIPDRSVPDSAAAFEGLLDHVDQHLRKNQAVVVHCRAGIGRSSMIAAALLLRRGLSAAEAFDLLSKARGCSVPDTPEQREWIERLAVRAKNAGER
jgi:protein-tyrosine phosphatase